MLTNPIPPMPAAQPDGDRPQLRIAARASSEVRDNPPPAAAVIALAIGESHEFAPIYGWRGFNAEVMYHVRSDLSLGLTSGSQSGAYLYSLRLHNSSNYKGYRERAISDPL